jgi:ribonuclease E
LTTPLASDETQTTTAAAPGEQGEEQRRRRRRRGGRNRNRRERESAETIEAGEVDAEIVEEGIEEAAALTGTFKPANVHPSEASEGEHAAQVASAEAPIAETHVNGALPVIHEAATMESSPLSSVIAAPAVPQQVARVIEPTPVAEVVSEEAAPAVATPATEVIAAPELAQPAATEHAVAAPKPAAQSTVVAASIAPAPMPLDELRAVLGAAGLTLATTNPDKLRAAQEAAAQIVVPPRVPRERKPLPPVSTEPLIQVETRQ